MNKGNICFFCHRAGIGGAERVITTLSNEFCSRGYDVSLVTTSPSDTDYTLVPEIHRMVIESKRNNVVFRTLERIAKLRKIIKNSHFDCIISFSAVPNIQVLTALMGIKTPVIISERTDPRKYPESRIGKALRKVLYPKASGIVFQTIDAKNYFDEKFRNKSVIIPNPISSELPMPFFGERDKRVVGVGALVDQKNWPVFLEACKSFLRNHPDYLVEIYGEGNRREDLERIILEDPFLYSNVRLMGFVDDVAKRIRTARIYVSSSDYEGISNSMLEALGMGIPSICTDCPVGGARMFIDGTNGLLVPVGDSERIESSMELLVTDDKLCDKFSKNAVSIREKLKVSTIADIWEEEILSHVKDKNVLENR